MSEWFKVKSETWGWLTVDELKIEGPFLRMLGVKSDESAQGLNQAECLIPVTDARLIVPPTQEGS